MIKKKEEEITEMALCCDWRVFSWVELGASWGKLSNFMFTFQVKLPFFF